MPDNLTITIRADTAKLRADLALGVADLKRFQQELNKVAAEASRSGDTAAVGQAAARVQQQTQYVAGLRQALGGLTQAHRQAAAATEDFHSKLAALREPIGRVREGISTFAERVLPAFVGALAGLTLGEVTRQLVEFTAKSAEATTQIKELAETLGATAPEIQAMQLAAVQAGRPLDSFTSSVERLQRQIGQARLAAQDLQQQQFGTGRVVDYGAGIDKSVSELRGLERIGVFLARFKGDVAGTQQAIAAIDAAFAKLGNSAKANAIAYEQWGRAWVEVRRDLASAGELEKAQTLIRSFGIEVTASEERATAGFTRALASLTTIGGRMASLVGNILGQALTPFFTGLTKLLFDNRDAIVGWANYLEGVLEALGRDVLKFIEQGSGAKFETSGMQTFVNLLGKAKETVTQLSAAFGALLAALDAVAGAVNALFGTQWTGKGILTVTALGVLSGAFQTLVGIIGTVTAAIWLMNAAAAVNPFVALATALVAVSIATAAYDKELTAGLNAAWDLWKSFADWLSTTFLNAIGLGPKSFKEFWGGVFSWMWDQVKSIGSAIANIWRNRDAAASNVGAAASSGANIIPGGMAAGGMVSGRGLGDSVGALLTPGEFVTRAAAVQHYGAGLFHALNQQRLPRFDFGGMVDGIHARVGPHFAEGGLVGEGGPPYAPINLYIGGGRFPMRAAQGVAAALVMEAQHAQMVSAGARPSWFGR